MKAKMAILLLFTLFMSYVTFAPPAMADGKYPVRIVDQNVMVLPIDEHTLQVIQVAIYENSGTKKELEIPVYLPNNYSQLELREGITPDTMRKIDKGIVDTTGLDAGEVKRYILSYLMPVDKKTSRWVIEQSYVTERFQVVIPAGAMSLEAPDLLTQSELLEMNDLEFRSFTRVDVHPNEPWPLFFRILNPQPSQEGMNSDDYTNDGKRILAHEHGGGYTKAVITLIIVFVALIVVLVGLKRDQHPKKHSIAENPERPWLMTEKASLLQQIGKLEQDFTAQLISAETYQATRKQLRDQLIRIAREIQREPLQ